MSIDIYIYKLHLVEKYKFKELERNWVYKIWDGGDMDAIHLCRHVGFAYQCVHDSAACSSCGDPLPFALKVYQTKYA